MLGTIIYINVFLAGVALTLAIWYAYAHFGEKKHHDKAADPDVPRLPKATRERLLLEAEERFHKILEHASGELQEDLKATSDAISGNLKRLGTETAAVEMSRYKAGLEEIRLETESTIKSAAADVNKHQEEIQASLTQHRQELQDALTRDMAAEKERLTTELDGKLADAIIAFLLETLGHEVDLGAQTSYMTKMLEEHKAEIIKELE